MVLHRAFALLRLLAGEPQGISLSEISVQLDLPKSSLSSILKALTEQEFLERKGSLYTLGPESFALSSVILAGRSIRQLARPYLRKTMEKCGETVLLAVPDPDMRHATYIDSVESPQAVRFVVTIGTRRPLYANACGRLFLANMPEEQRKRYLESVPLTPVTEKTITDPVQLDKLLAKVREDNLSVTLGDYLPDAGGFAAPIYNSDGDLIAALTIEVPISRAMDEEATFREFAREAAREISRVLGYKGLEREA
jgi:DNA-binding IclR family transcriptional regulator